MRAALLLVGLLCFAQGEQAVQWTLRAPATAKAGETIRATVTAKIAGGWHLYSMKELEGGPRPTQFKVPAESPFHLAGTIEAPRPLVFHDKNFDMDVEYYEESAEFVIPLEAAAGAKSGEASLSVTARFQACNDKLCLPPKNVRMDAVVSVK